MFVEYIRGGGARYAYGEELDEKIMQNAQARLQLNQPLMSIYKDIFPLNKLRRMQLRIIAGIEMFYGNFKRFKFFFAVKEIPELAELMYLSGKVKTMQLEDAHSLLEQGKGMEAVDELLKETAQLEQKRRELLNTILENRKDIMKKYSITASELSSL